MTEKDRIRRNLKSLKYHKKNARAVVETRWRNKMRLIQYKGGKCEKCYYNKPVAAAYHFHHRNPNEKEFGLGKHMSRSLEILKKEVDKCELLCANCHSEEHDKEHALSREQTIKTWQEWDIEEEARRKRKLPTSKICKTCLNKFKPLYKQQIYCSPDCRILDRRIVKNRPSKEELTEMISRMSWVAIARQWNVCDNTIREWARQYGIEWTNKTYPRE